MGMTISSGSLIFDTSSVMAFPAVSFLEAGLNADGVVVGCNTGLGAEPFFVLVTFDLPTVLGSGEAFTLNHDAVLPAWKARRSGSW